jgi:hypothetical protein
VTERDRLPARDDGTRQPAERPAGTIAFIVRVAMDAAGGLVGIVEHVRTGRKERFERLEALPGVIATLMAIGARRDRVSGDEVDVEPSGAARPLAPRIHGGEETPM